MKFFLQAFLCCLKPALLSEHFCFIVVANANAQTTFTFQNMPRLQSPFPMAEEVAEGLGRGYLLQ
ncbi:hypothetical protein SAMN05444008_108247 [Cnuella takakiae]|uniref:Uncharacterized protein n=1 Tax=Cnuella takakiae TaxID=1302690 RepID=A0A1M5C5L7_9BACT|nr:hypothetical protein [Cnuella takakiae]SHF50001.1 hypothetical protein SAMN05444008_108247 [Cnuella takakiae]